MLFTSGLARKQIAKSRKNRKKVESAWYVRCESARLKTFEKERLLCVADSVLRDSFLQ